MAGNLYHSLYYSPQLFSLFSISIVHFGSSEENNDACYMFTLNIVLLIDQQIQTLFLFFFFSPHFKGLQACLNLQQLWKKDQCSNLTCSCQPVNGFIIYFNFFIMYNVTILCIYTHFPRRFCNTIQHSDDKATMRKEMQMLRIV